MCRARKTLITNVFPPKVSLGSEQYSSSRKQCGQWGAGRSYINIYITPTQQKKYITHSLKSQESEAFASPCDDTGGTSKKEFGFHQSFETFLTFTSRVFFFLFGLFGGFYENNLYMCMMRTGTTESASSVCFSSPVDKILVENSTEQSQVNVLR